LRKKNNQRVETYKRFSSREDCINKDNPFLMEFPNGRGRLKDSYSRRVEKVEKEKKKYNEEEEVRQIDVP